MMKIVVAVTGASGAIYARLLLEQLCALDVVEQIALIVSKNGREVAGYERQTLPDHPKIVCYGPDDLFASPASGSARWDAMAIVPCSMGVLGRIASGISSGLIGRAADVMLKERRRLVLVTRETPLNTIHLRNMAALSECGAVILPASPSFYALPTDMTSLCMSVVERATAMLGLDAPHYAWDSPARPE